MTGRSANGESTISKGADGRWHGYVSVGFTIEGKPDRRHVTSKTRAAVVQKVRELEIERKRDTGTISAVSTPTVADWLEHWLTTIAPRRVRQRTLESYESAVRKHLVPGLGRHRLDRLRPEHLDQLYTALLDAGYSPATVLRQHRILSRALTVAMQRGHVARNIATLVDPPAQKQSDVATALDLGEARAVLTAAQHVRNSARWTVALALGLRQSEALALQWKDIDLLANTLTVRRSIHRVRGGGLIYDEPKSRRSQRTLALPLPLVANCTGTRPPSSASGCWPARSGTTSTWSSPSPTADPSTRRPTTTTGPGCCRRPARAAARRTAHRRHPAAE
jgi:integrase